MGDHANKGNTNDVVCWHADKHFVEDAREDEYDDLSERSGNAAANKRAVNMATHEVGDWLVPSRPVRPNTANVPPVSVEFAVAKSHDLGQSIECRLKESEEAAEPAKYGDGRQLHDAFDNGGQIEIKHHVQRITQQWSRILCGSYPDNNAEANKLDQSAEDKPPSNLLGTRIYGLVDESWRPPEIAEIPKVDIPGIWTRVVELGKRASLLGMEVGMAKVTVRQSVRCTLEKHDDSMELDHGPNSRVVDLIVDSPCCKV